MRLVDIGWAAGFYEGEGSFSASELRGVPFVNITQKDIEPLLKIEKLFGGKITQHNGYNYWRVFGVEARQFILTVFTLLSARRKKQILKFKEFFTTPDACPNGHIYVEGSFRMNYDPRTEKESRQCLECQRNKLKRRVKFLDKLTPENRLVFEESLKRVKEQGYEISANTYEGRKLVKKLENSN